MCECVRVYVCQHWSVYVYVCVCVGVCVCVHACVNVSLSASTCVCLYVSVNLLQCLNVYPKASWKPSGRTKIIKMAGGFSVKVENSVYALT